MFSDYVKDDKLTERGKALARALFNKQCDRVP
jgi:hypothetical protein